MAENRKERAQAMPTTPSVHTNNCTTKKTQWQVVLDELLEAGEDGITAWDMIVKHHITRTADCIFKLKKMGYPILSVIETNNGKNYSRYWLEGEEDDEEEEEDIAYHDYVDEPYIDDERERRWYQYCAVAQYIR